MARHKKPAKKKVNTKKHIYIHSRDKIRRTKDNNNNEIGGIYIYIGLYDAHLEDTFSDRNVGLH